MAHFAELDENNIVTRIVTVHNNELKDESGQESEAKGVAFLQSLYGAETKWAQTSFNANIRREYAVVGGKYYPEQDVFVGLQPFPSWTLNATTFEWEPPVPAPGLESEGWGWHEDQQQWVKLEMPSGEMTPQP